MAESKTVDGAVEELLLGDGFSIVDSTNTTTTTATKSEANNDAESKKSPPKEDDNISSETKKSESTAATKKPVEEKPVVKKEDEKKPEPVKKAAAAVAAAAEPKKTEDKIKDDKKTDVEPEAKEEKLNGHGSNVEKSDSLLITTEEDLELDKKTESDTKDDDAKKKEKDKDSKKKANGDVWVSNITRHVKATDVKKHFSRHGKVLTAKIVTNGRSFFGYILMETAEIANKCVKTLHGTLLEGRKISVSRSRPDSQRRADRKTDTGSRSVKKPSEKPGDKKADSKDRKKEADKKPVEKSKDDILIADLRRTQRKLHLEIDFHKREVIRLKRFLQEEKQKVRAEQSRSRGLQSDLEEAENKLRSERRKMEREREVVEKTARSDRVKLESDRTMMKKELEEVKKLREYLKRKIEEEQARVSAREEPRRTRASSPYAYSSKRFREDPESKSSSKYEERTRTPPSPPKLSSSSSRKRSPMGSFVEKERTSSRHYDVGGSSSFEKESRHSSMVLASKPSAPAPPRNIWPSPFHQEVWRMAPSAASSASPFSSGQFTRPSDYSQGSSSKGPAAYSSSSREYSKRDHYSSSSVRKY